MQSAETVLGVLRAIVTGELRAPKGARVVRTGGRWSRTVATRHLASGLPVSHPPYRGETRLQLGGGLHEGTDGIDEIEEVEQERDQ